MNLGNRATGAPKNAWLPQLRQLLMVLCVISCGCNSGDPSPFYSGEFEVLSENKTTIFVKDWSNFGGARPAGGNIASESECGTHYPKLSRIPESTVVSWVIDGSEDGQLYSQEIDLKDVVPKDAEGHTEFTFGEDAVWTVKFVRANE